MTQAVELPKIGPDLHQFTEEQHQESMKARVRTLADPPAIGRYPGWPMDRYLAADAVNAGVIKAMVPPDADPADALASRFLIKGDTPATKQGTAIHAAILEPERFDTRYVVTPTRGKGLADYRKELAEAGYVSLSQTQMDIARTCRDHFHEDPLASKMLAGIGREHVEQTFFFDVVTPVGDTEDLIKLRGKMRCDLARDDLAIWGDIKSTASFDVWPFQKQSAQLNYDVTKAWYQRGIDACEAAGFLAPIKDYLFVVIENVFPCRVKVRQMDGAATQQGADKMRHGLRAWAACVQANEWPSSDDGEHVQPFTHPDYDFESWGSYLEHKETTE